MPDSSSGASTDGAVNRVAKYTGFIDGSEYLQAILNTPKNLTNRLFHRSNAAELKEDAGNHTGLLPSLRAVDLVGLGVGMMLGAGVFVSTGSVAANYTGPSVIIAFFIAGVCAFLSSFIYAEFTVDLPFAGGAYNYVLCSLGEFLAWVSVSNLLFTYVLGNAAVMRGFAPYFASLCNQPTDFFTYQWHGYTIDWFAFCIPVLLTCLLVRGTRDSATANLIITVIHLIIMVFIIITGFTQAKSENFTSNFAPFGWREVFNGAAQLFFSFIGFDAVATLAEEVVDPQKDLPKGILGSVGIVTVIYILMGAVLCLMVPFDMLDSSAPFTSAFDYVGLSWAKYIVAVGALLGILTGVFVGILGASRLLTSSGRESMLPPVVAMVGKRQTPWVATWSIGGITAIIGLFTSFDNLIDLVSIGVLLVFWLVALACVWRRNYVPGETSTMGVVSTVSHLVAFIGLALAFSITWVLETGGDQNYIYNAVFLGCAILVAFSMFFFCKPVYTPAKYVCPIYPFIPCASLFLNTFLLSQLSESGWILFGYWTCVVVGVYLLYSMPASWVHDRARGKQHAQTNLQKMMESGSGSGVAAKPVVIISSANAL